MWDRKTSGKSSVLAIYEPEINPKLDIFFYVTEFLFGTTLQQIALLFKILPGDHNPSYSDINKYVLPFIVLLWLYLTDSYVGKLTATYVICVMGAILQLAIVIIQAAQLPLDAQAIQLSLTLVGDILRPVRWALMYTTKPIKPFKVIRRFVILTEMSYLLGKTVMNAVKMVLLPRYNRHHRLDIIIPVIIMTKLILYPLFVHLIYKKIMNCPMHFKMFSVESAAKDVSSVVLKKLCKNKFQQPSADRNQVLGVGILVVLAVFIPYVVARYDYELIKTFCKMNRDFLIEKNLSGAVETIEPIITILSLLLIEFGLLRIAENTVKWRPYYLTWMTYCFIIILAALIMMIYIYLMLENEIPFPKLPPGKAHMTVFNCLPASIEIEWPRQGKIDKVRNQNYIRKLLIPLRKGKTETIEVVVYNKPIGMYRKVNITLEEGRENVFVATFDGLTRANMKEKLAFSRFENEKAEVRVLDCLEICCHGSISFTPTRPTLQRTSTSIELSKNILSEKHGFAEGKYKLAYHPDENTTLGMGIILLKRLDKTILLIHSIQNPAYRAWDMVTLSKSNSAVYIPMAVLVGMFRITHAFEKMAIVIKTIPEIYSAMFGIHITLNKLAVFGAAAYFAQEDLDHKSFFLILGFSMFGFLIYLAVVFKLKKHFQASEEPQAKEDRKIRGRSTSKSSIATNETTGTFDPRNDMGKMKNQ